MELLKKLILAFLGLGVAIALTACDDQEGSEKAEDGKNPKERYHRKW